MFYLFVYLNLHTSLIVPLETHSIFMLDRDQIFSRVFFKHNTELFLGSAQKFGDFFAILVHFDSRVH